MQAKNAFSMIKLGFISLVATALIACGPEKLASSTAESNSTPQQIHKWKMVTSWPKKFPWFRHSTRAFL
jgi:TRAP-type mannitol/chloroaromatic compound transport system substrate-binding protein